MSNIKSMILAYMNDWHDGYWLVPLGVEESRRKLAVDVILYHTEGRYSEPLKSKADRYEAKLMELIEDGTIRETQLSDRETEYEVL